MSSKTTSCFRSSSCCCCWRPDKKSSPALSTAFSFCVFLATGLALSFLSDSSFFFVRVHSNSCSTSSTIAFISLTKTLRPVNSALSMSGKRERLSDTIDTVCCKSLRSTLSCEQSDRSLLWRRTDGRWDSRSKSKAGERKEDESKREKSKNRD